jgi:hypothetical protein
VALLKSANESYSASLDAYKYGVKNLIDVVTAEKQLALARLSGVVHIQYLAQSSLRVSVFLQWIWSCLTGRGGPNSSLIPVPPSQTEPQRRHAAARWQALKVEENAAELECVIQIFYIA